MKKIKNKDEMKQNIGYIHITGIREYIKLRPSDEENYWPRKPEGFRAIFDNFFISYKNIANTCLEILSNFVEEGRHNPKKLPLIDKEKLEAIQEFLDSKSSVSMIHYFQNKENETCACGEHTDTGILTLLMHTQVPSLEIWDKSLEKFVKIEELTESTDLILFMGEKIPMFTGSKKFIATPHRVIMPPGKERISLALLLDVAK